MPIKVLNRRQLCGALIMAFGVVFLMTARGILFVLTMPSSCSTLGASQVIAPRFEMVLVAEQSTVVFSGVFFFVYPPNSRLFLSPFDIFVVLFFLLRKFGLEQKKKSGSNQGAGDGGPSPLTFDFIWAL